VNKRQISVVRHFLTVIIVTLLFVFGLINVRDMMNRSEMQREMESLAQSIKEYRQTNGSMPPESVVRPILERFSRLNPVDYRAKSILYDSPPDTVIASCKQRSYSILVETAYIALRLDGRIEWLSPADFERIMKEQEDARQQELYKLYGTPLDTMK
jgi:hypothetical protein